jgi:hypothetical protein
LVDRATPPEPDPASGRLRTTAVFRGVPRGEARLLTVLDRLGGMNPPHTKGALEEHLLRNFLRYGRPFLRYDQNDPWELMVVAEHHGLPTRLLDWTESPLIAAHFATLPGEGREDRVVWKLDWRKLHARFGLREVVFLLEDLNAELARRGFRSVWEFLDREPEDRQDFVCLFEPPAVTDRLSVQSGAFTVCSSKIKTVDQLLEESGETEALEQFVIPADAAERIRDQLDLCTVDERRLFPGLDGIAAGLKRYYSSSGIGATPANPDADYAANRD